MQGKLLALVKIKMKRETLTHGQTVNISISKKRNRGIERNEAKVKSNSSRGNITYVMWQQNVNTKESQLSHTYGIATFSLYFMG